MGGATLDNLKTRRGDWGLKLGALSPRVSRDVSLQLVNRGTLSGDNPVDQVADRNYSQDSVAFQHREMPDAMVGHQPHALFHRVRRRHVHDALGEDFFDGSLFGRFAFERDLAGVIALRNDAYKSSMVCDQQRADVFVGHHLDGIEDGRLRRNRPDRRSLMAQEFADGPDRSHRWSPPRSWARAQAAWVTKPIFEVPIASGVSWPRIFMHDSSASGFNGARVSPGPCE